MKVSDRSGEKLRFLPIYSESSPGERIIYFLAFPIWRRNRVVDMLEDFLGWISPFLLSFLTKLSWALARLLPLSSSLLLGLIVEGDGWVRNESHPRSDTIPSIPFILPYLFYSGSRIPFHSLNRLFVYEWSNVKSLGFREIYRLYIYTWSSQTAMVHIIY